MIRYLPNGKVDREAWGNPYTGCDMNELADALDAATLQERRLREVLRAFAIERGRSRDWCLQCHGQWPVGQPEAHAPDCLCQDAAGSETL